jgi:hypothetical protein
MPGSGISEIAYLGDCVPFSLGIRGASWCNGSGCSGGKPFNVSSDHHIIGIQGKDMAAAMRPTQDHHGRGGRDVLRERPPVSYAYPTRPRNPPRIDTGDCSATCQRLVPHMVCTITAESRPRWVPCGKSRQHSWSGSACAAGNRDYRCSLQTARSHLACLRSSTSRLGTDAIVRPASAKWNLRQPCHHSQFHAALPCKYRKMLPAP